MGKLHLDDIDLNGLDPVRTAVNCQTQEEADIFLEYLCKKGLKSRKDVDALKHGWAGSSTCYRIDGSGWSYRGWYENMRVAVVDFCEIYKPTPVYEVNYFYEELFR